LPISHKIPDPIHGHLTIPEWLREIESYPSVRRMLYIRQLGLKSSIDFPGAIHTRYGHSLGVMHLAGLLADNLASKMHDNGKRTIAKNLEDNKNILMAAGLLHDIAHGPFSHAVDYVLYKTAKVTHEKLSEQIISDLKVPLTNHGIAPESVINIINKKHDFKFLSGIVNGPMDVDKLDYLLRDAHHVGLKYGFDLEHFIGSYTVLGSDTNLSECKLGLDNTLKAQVTAEIFIMIWKGMYDLVYHVRDSRIAEKMLEKATILGIENDGELKDYFTDKKLLLTLYDEKLLSLLQGSKNEYAKELEERIRNRKLFESYPDILFYENKEIDSNFILKVTAASTQLTDEISDGISKNVCKELGVENYNIICDIVKTRVPSSVFIDSTNVETGEPDELSNKSNIIKAIKERNTMRIYVDPNMTSKPPKDLLTKKVNEVIKKEAEG